MEQDKWKEIGERYVSDQGRADFAAAPYPEGFDQAAYSAQWADLVARIEAAMPMDPASAQAKAFHAEWQALLAPFKAVATPAMMQGVGKMYDDIDQWKGEQKPPFSAEVWAFIKQVGACG